jgi:ADP-ribosylglycohydrolase
MESVPETIGHYTDDTELSFALVEALSWCRSSIVAQHEEFSSLVVFSSALWFCRPPGRGGYSAVTFRKLVALHRRAREVVDPMEFWEEAMSGALRKLLDQESATPGSTEAVGSYGNGAPMRIAPLGFALREVVARGDLESAHRAVFAAVSFTHSHPEAVDASFILAVAVARCSVLNDDDVVDPVEFLSQLASECHTEELRSRLQGVVTGLGTCSAVPRDEDSPMFVSAEKDLLQSLCTPDKWFQIRAVDAVSYVLFFFCRYGGLAERRPAPTAAAAALVRLVAIGGDTDTLGCMLGSLLGSLHGDAWILQEWVERFETDAVFGFPRAIELGNHLAHLDVEKGNTESGYASLIARIHGDLVSYPEPQRFS